MSSAFGFSPSQVDAQRKRAPGRPSTILVSHEGRMVTLMELSISEGVNYEALRKRYRNGLRGKALLERGAVGRPIITGKWSMKDRQ